MGLIAILAVVAAAVCIVLQGRLNGQLQQSVGVINTVLWVHLSVTLAMLPVALVLKQRFIPGVGAVMRDSGFPWALTGGLLGIVIVGGLSFAVPVIGIKKTFFILVAAQLVTALAIDARLGERRFEAGGAMAAALLLVAAYLVIFRTAR